LFRVRVTSSTRARLVSWSLWQVLTLWALSQCGCPAGLLRDFGCLIKLGMILTSRLWVQPLASPGMSCTLPSLTISITSNPTNVLPYACNPGANTGTVASLIWAWIKLGVWMDPQI
jgi:hypothetical protein